MSVVRPCYVEILEEFFQKLESEKIDYCVCGNYEHLPYYTNNDVDIWVSNPTLAFRLLKFAAEKLGINIYLSNHTANGFNVFLFKENNNDIECYHIDLLQDCSWFSFIPLVAKDTISSNRMLYKGFWVANDTVEAVMHFLYPLITYGIVKEKYRDKIYKVREQPLLYQSIFRLFGKTYAQIILEYINTCDWISIEQMSKKLRYKLILNILRMNLRPSFKNMYYFLKSNLSRLIKPTGLFISFIGLDGSGKTTLIASMEEFFKNCFTRGKIKHFYWRPFLFPEPGKIVKWFRRNEPTHFTVSSTEFFDYRIRKINNTFAGHVFYLFKFFYYLIDYMFGRYKYQGIWSRGGVVCFDRYYYDLLVFPERFGFKVSKKLICLFTGLIPKPDICFYLYSPTDTLIQRKGELPEAEIIRQTNEYDALLDKNFNIIKIDTSGTIQNSNQEIIGICLDKMSKRYVST